MTEQNVFVVWQSQFIKLVLISSVVTVSRLTVFICLFVCLFLSYFAVKRSYEQAFIISVSV